MGMTIRRSSTRLLQLEAPPLDLQAPRDVIEQPVLQLLHAVIQALHRLELTIDDVVQQPVQQVADAEFGEVGAFVPALDDRVDVQPVVLADGDQRLAGDEGRDLAGAQLAGAGVQPRPVGGQEQVAAVAVKLGPLAVAQRGLDGQRVQAELLAQHGEVVAVGVTQVQPDGDGLISQVFADVGDRESLKLELPVPVQPRARLAPGRADLTDR
jgi:hypothetical protein